jgi:hypothetical protein
VKQSTKKGNKFKDATIDRHGFQAPSEDYEQLNLDKTKIHADDMGNPWGRHVFG